jgi:hypothetical protein
MRASMKQEDGTFRLSNYHLQMSQHTIRSSGQIGLKPFKVKSTFTIIVSRSLGNTAKKKKEKAKRKKYSHKINCKNKTIKDKVETYL